MSAKFCTCAILLLAVVNAAAALGQPGPGLRMGQSMMDGMGPGCKRYRRTFQALLHAHEQIERKVTPTEMGITSETWSEDPDITKLIQQHVAEMQELMKGCAEGSCPAQPRWWDPVFAAAYATAGQIDLQATPTDKGVKVTQTGSDNYAKRVIRAHADVVTKFVKNGHAEAQKAHEVA